MKEQRLFNKKMRDLDPAIWSLAQKAELGELRAIYHVSKRATLAWLSGWTWLAWGVTWLLFSCAAIVASWPHVSLFWALPGLLLCAGGSSLLIPSKRYAHWHVYLWDSGFVYEKGPVRQVFRWDQIESIQSRFAYNLTPDSAIAAYKVRRQDGYEVILKNVFVNNAELIKAVAEAFVREVTARELIVPSRSQIFTLFTLDRQGLKDKDSTLSWQEIAIEKGIMTVLKPKSDFPVCEQERDRLEDYKIATDIDES